MVQLRQERHEDIDQRVVFKTSMSLLTELVGILAGFYKHVAPIGAETVSLFPSIYIIPHIRVYSRLFAGYVSRLDFPFILVIPRSSMPYSRRCLHATGKSFCS
jgi:hypothetical protein